MLDTESLKAIAREARSCFLFEDAPEYQSELAAGLKQLRAGGNDSEAIAALMKTAHSLKGGAGIAELPSLAQLAHRFEDLLEALYAHRVPEPQTAYRLLERCVESVDGLVAAAARAGADGEAAAADLDPDSDIVAELEQFLAGLPDAPAGVIAAALAPEAGLSPSLHALRSAIAVDLDEYLQQLEDSSGGEVSAAAIAPRVQAFCDACQALGERLGLDWLRAAVQPLRTALDARVPALPDLARKTLAHLRQQRERVLSELPATRSPQSASPPPSLPAPSAPPAIEPTPAPVRASVPQLQVRMPVERLDRLNNTLGELLVGYERFTLLGEQLQQASAALKRRADRLGPISEQVEALYDRLATDARTGARQSRSRGSHEGGDRGNSAFEGRAAGAGEDFDPLQFDRYGDLHLTLQDLQELMVQVQENRADIDAIHRDYTESLEDLRASLELLRGDLTESRLVPFRSSTEKFRAALQTLNARYGKNVTLDIVGEDTPVDRVVLEQLQTPLNHLFRNAFDHGIESVAERAAAGKPPEATIALSAELQGSRVEIAVADDGRGIDLQRVWRKAVERGLLPSDRHLQPREILDAIFAPGFSTAERVSDLSGRGVGLDVVRLQVERLRGSVRVETELGRGTRFILELPLALSILPMLLCRADGRAIALPSAKVLEAISLADAPSRDEVLWQGLALPVYPLARLLPYAQPSAGAVEPTRVLVLDVGGTPLAVAVDALEGERELVLKPFDRTVTVPPYLAGCTVLGTGAVVPVVNPSYLSVLLSPAHLQELDRRGKLARETVAVESEPTILIADDSVAVRRSLSRLLEQAGYRVVACRDGKEALGALEAPNATFAMCVTDIEMPQLDGFGLLQAIRAMERWRELPVAMLTSRDNPRHRETATRLGASDYLGKPFRAEELLAAIDRWSRSENRTLLRNSSSQDGLGNQD